MRDELYRELVDVVTVVSRRATDPPGASDGWLVDWHRWARGFCAGLYSRRTAQRVAHATWLHAMHAVPMSAVAYAAASAAWGVMHAADGDEMAARLAIKSAHAALAPTAVPPASVAVPSSRPPAPRGAR